MKITDATIGMEVVKSKDINYDNGEYGVIVEIDEIKQRAKINWGGCHSTLKINKLEPKSIPHKIVAPKHGEYFKPYYAKL